MGWFLSFLEGFVLFFNIAILLYFAALNLFYLVLSIMASHQLFKFKVRSGSRFRNMREVPILPTVSVLSPAYNEEVTIAESLKSQLNLDYPELRGHCYQ